MNDLANITSRYNRNRKPQKAGQPGLAQHKAGLGLSDAMGVMGQRHGRGASGTVRLPDASMALDALSGEDEGMDALMQYATLLSRARPNLSGQPPNPFARMG